MSNQNNKLHKTLGFGSLLRGAVVGALSLALAGCSLLPSEEQPLKPPLAKPAVARIVTAEAEVGTLERSLQGAASFESVRSSYHRFTETGGRVEEVLARAGDAVKAGDPLLRLDTGEMRIALLQRQLEVEKKKLGLDEARAAKDERRIRIAQLELEIAEMAYDSIKKAYDSKVLVAQMDGVVTFGVDLEPGDVVDAYRTLFIISDPGQLRLAYAVASTGAVSEVQLGMTAEVTYEKKVYAGKVVQTPSSAPFEEDERLRERYARTLYLDLEQFPVDAKIGDTASVRIIIARKENAVILPKNGVRRMFGRTFVQVLDGESRREQDVETGLETPTEIEILNGLEPGVQVVLQ